MPSYSLTGSPTVIDGGASLSAQVQNTGVVPILVGPLGRQVAPGATVTVPCWGAVRTTLWTAGQTGAATVTLTGGTPAAQPGPGGVTLDPGPAASMSVSITGGTWFTDEGLKTSATFPVTVTAPTVLYPAAPATVTVTCTVGTASQVRGFNVTSGSAEAVRWEPSSSSESVATAVSGGAGTFAPLASPALTGNPTVPTQTAGNSSTRAASTAFVGTAVSTQHAADVGTFGRKDSSLFQPALGRWDVDRVLGSRVMTTPPVITVGAGGTSTGLGIVNPSAFRVIGGAASGNVYYLPADSGLPASPIAGQGPVPVRLLGAVPYTFTGGGQTWLMPHINGPQGAAPNIATLQVCHDGAKIGFALRGQSFVQVLFRIDGEYASLTPTAPGTDAAFHYCMLDFQVGSSWTFTDTGDIATSATAHGLAVGDRLIPGTITTTTGITAGTTYYVLTVPSSTTVTLSAAPGGSTLALTGNGSTTSMSLAKARTVEMIGQFVFRGIQIGPVASAWLPPRPRRPRWYTLGDSFFGGSNAGSIFTSMIPQVMQRIGVDDYMHDAIGSTGFLDTNGSANNYLDRLNSTNISSLDYSPDGFLLGGSINDSGAGTQQQITTQANLVFDRCAAINPAAPVVVPVFASSYPVDAGHAYTLAALQAAAAGRSNVFVVSMQDAFTGTGLQGTPAGAGSSDVLRSSDGSHPSQAGHDYYATRIAQIIQAYVPGYAA